MSETEPVISNPFPPQKNKLTFSVWEYFGYRKKKQTKKRIVVLKDSYPVCKKM